MATLNVANAQRIIGVHGNNKSEAVTPQENSFLSRFASAAYIWAEKYGEYKYNHSDWRAFRF